MAHLLGFELRPRIRNWKDLAFFRPARQINYAHIDALFGRPGRNVIDRDRIEQHFRPRPAALGNRAWARRSPLLPVSPTS